MAQVRTLSTARDTTIVGPILPTTTGPILEGLALGGLDLGCTLCPAAELPWLGNGSPTLGLVCQISTYQS